jgi:hypothetical protein
VIRQLTTFLLIGIWPSLLCGDEWRPASAPLSTRWSKEVSPERVLAEYPRPQMVRDAWQNLNGLWQLAIADEGESPPLGQDLARRILVPFPIESALSGVMEHAERLWYRRLFTLPSAWSGKRVLLHFGAVDWETRVWVNGHELGTHRGGYDPFSFDITDALADAGPQEIVVGVFDPTDGGPQPRGKQVSRPQGIYYSPTTGIWQTVWLEPVAESHLGKLRIVPDVDAMGVRVSSMAERVTDAHRVRITIRQGERVVGSGSGDVGKSVEIKIPGAKLWSPESPFLYDLDVELLEGDQVVDRVRSYCGLRKIEVGRDERGVTRILLNDQPYFQVGPLDQGFWPDGLYTAPSDEALRYDLEMTKELGFNMTRKHVKVEPARWYYWCDKLGLLVWQDMPSGDASVGQGKGEIHRMPYAAEQFEQELKRMIDALSNHPSIVMWVVFNEGWGQFDTARLTNWVKGYDPTRLTNGASGWNDMQVGDVHDIHAYPGPRSPEPETRRAAVLGEFGGLGLGVDGHTWAQRTWGYRSMQSSDELTRKYERLLEEVWKLKDKPGLSAAVYTQITDVETEANGLLTYDRAVVKVDKLRLAAANRGDFSLAPRLTTVMPTARQEAALWRYRHEPPLEGWQSVQFDAGSWTQGQGGFGTRGTPGATVRTEWKTADIWLRGEVTLAEGDAENLFLNVHHDEDAEIYVNGVLAAKLAGYTTDYEEVALAEPARAALKPGKNVLAVHCHQTGGGQYIDVGLVRIARPK